jgi:hypothetical protein
MDNKAFLEKCRSKESSSTSSGFNVELKGNRKLLPLNDVANVISLAEQYDEERAACNKIRLTCQINTVCSNVLFNKISEIVKYEGSDHVTFLNYGIGESFKDSEDNDVYEAFQNNQVIYKPTSMSYWSGGTLLYQKVDERVVVSGPSTDLSRVDRSDVFKNGVLGEDGLHPTNAIRDTQLSRNDSNEDHFVYHCGLDILNNHLIRSKTFKCICKMSDKYDKIDKWSDKEYGAFNTIADVMRQAKGDKVVEKVYLPENSGIPEGTKLTTLHTYLYDDIYTFADARVNRLIEKHNGWVGFINTSKIKTYKNFSEGDELNVERPIMYMNGGDFVDMYPGRDLYSFVPKYNKYRNRMEQNWLYCITYPSSSTTDGFDDIIEQSNNSLKAVYFDETRRADSGAMQLVIYSKAKHGLNVGDRVNIYKTYYVEIEEETNTSTEEEVAQEENDATTIENIETQEDNDNTTTEEIQEEEPKKKRKRTTDLIIANVEVENIVNDFIFTTFTQGVQISEKWITLTDDDAVSESGFTIDGVTYKMSTDGKDYIYNVDTFDRYFIIGGDDASQKVNNHGYVNIDDNAQRISYKKVVNDIECDYYVRIFSRLPNFRFASGDTSNEYNIYKKNGDEPSMLEQYQTPEYPFESYVSRLAFAKNIYSDDIGQIVFTDDIDISNLHDNLGRPLSDIYLTIVKNNRGYKEWYGYDDTEVDINSPKVEFSHCFGEVTCGIEMAEETIVEIYNNNIRCINPLKGNNWGYSVGSINGHRNSNEDSDTIYPDQEVVFDTDINYYGDLCYFDSYNAIERSIQPIMHRFNTAQRECGGPDAAKMGEYFARYYYDEIEGDDYDHGDAFRVKDNFVDECNVKPEGYFYQPHHRIRIKSFGKINTIMPQFLNMQSLYNTEENGKNVTKITTQQYHFLTQGDKAVIYDKQYDKHYYLTAIPGKGDSDRNFTCMICDEKGNPTDVIDGDNLGNYKLFKADNLGAPSYATLLKDGTCRYVWREIVPNGTMDSEKSLEAYPFTNGALYVNKSVDLFVRRQDPDDIFGLYDPDDEFGVQPSSDDINNYSSEDEIKC